MLHDRWRQGSHPFFRNKFPGLFQDSDGFFQGCKIHINPFTPKISMLILLTVCHTFHIFHLSLTDFQNFPGPAAFFQEFPFLENATIKFQDFPGFPGPVRTLWRSEQATNIFVKEPLESKLQLTRFSLVLGSISLLPHCLVYFASLV